MKRSIFIQCVIVAAGIGFFSASVYSLTINEDDVRPAIYLMEAFVASVIILLVVRNGPELVEKCRSFRRNVPPSLRSSEISKTYDAAVQRQAMSEDETTTIITKASTSSNVNYGSTYSAPRRVSAKNCANAQVELAIDCAMGGLPKERTETESQDFQDYPEDDMDTYLSGDEDSKPLIPEIFGSPLSCSDFSFSNNDHGPPVETSDREATSNQPEKMRLHQCDSFVSFESCTVLDAIHENKEQKSDTAEGCSENRVKV